MTLPMSSPNRDDGTDACRLNRRLIHVRRDDATVGDGVALAGQVGIIGHLSIGDGARVAAQAGVSHDIPAGETWFGYPARPRTQVMRANAAFLKLPELVRRVRAIEQKLEEDT